MTASWAGPFDFTGCSLLQLTPGSLRYRRDRRTQLVSLDMNKELNSSRTRGRALLARDTGGQLVANVTAQAFDLSVFISAAFGLVAIASGVALFSNYRRNRGDSRS